MLNKFLIFIFSVLIFTGCSYKEDVTVVSYKDSSNIFRSSPLLDGVEKSSRSIPNSTNKYTSKKSQTNTNTNNNPNQNTDDTADISKELNAFYKEWEGVRYKLGGTSKKGIDCSGFTQKVFKEKLDFTLPRTAIGQSQLGKSISKSQLNTGDLVFFKIGKNTKHVGIYLDNGKFLHASTSNGVTISTLNSEYFTKHYWKSQRIFD